jgi:hypothetical protein
LRLRAVAAFFPAATRFGDFRVVAFRAVVRFRVVEAFRAAAVLRLRAVAAFFPAATRFGDFRVVALRAVVRFRAVAALRAVVRLRVAGLRTVVRFRAVAALRAAVFRTAVFRVRVVAAFFPATTRFGDFRVVALRAVARLRAVAALLVAVFLEATFRLRVAAFAFAAVAALRPAVDLRVVAGRVIASFMGPPIPGGMVSDRGVGRSHAGVSGRQDGSGVLGASRVLVSSTSSACSVLSDTGFSASFRGIPSWGRSFVVRSSDDGMTTSSARGSPGSRTRPYSERCM